MAASLYLCVLFPVLFPVPLLLQYLSQMPKSVPSVPTQKITIQSLQSLTM